MVKYRYPEYYKNKGLYACKPAGIYRTTCINATIAELTGELITLHSIKKGSQEEPSNYKYFLNW